VDFETLENAGGVTIRDRDSGKQERVAEGDILDFLREKLLI
jgi:glycyl-tRNA synthetase (class II)